MGQDCRNLAVSRTGWARIAAILPFPGRVGSGLPQSCRFPDGLGQDCRNLAVSRTDWVRIAAILPFPGRIGSGFPAILRFQPGNCPDSGKSKIVTDSRMGLPYSLSLTFLEDGLLGANLIAFAHASIPGSICVSPCCSHWSSPRKGWCPECLPTRMREGWHRRW